MGKLKAIFFGNCHMNNYCSMLRNKSNFNNFFNSEYIVSYENIGCANIFYNAIKDCDLIIMNKITSYPKFSSDLIESLIPKNSKIIYVPYMRFDGFFDVECSLKNFKSNVLSSFPKKIMEGIDCNEYLHQSANDIDVKIKETILNKFNDAVEKLDDIDNKSTIKIKKHFIENYKFVPTFMDCNHPTNYMFYYVYSQLVEIIEKHFNIDLGNTHFYNPKNYCPGKWFGHFSVIPDHIKEILDLQFNLDAYFIVSRDVYLRKIYDYEMNDNPIIDDFGKLSKLLTS